MVVFSNECFNGFGQKEIDLKDWLESYNLNHNEKGQVWYSDFLSQYFIGHEIVISGEKRVWNLQSIGQAYYIEKCKLIQE